MKVYWHSPLEYDKKILSHLLILLITCRLPNARFKSIVLFTMIIKSVFRGKLISVYAGFCSH